MKKILSLVVIGCLMMSLNAFGAVDWTKNDPAGTRQAADLDYYIATVNNASIDRLVSNYRENCAIYYISASSIGIKVGECVGSNAAGTVRKFRKNTSVVTLNWANIDTGSEQTSTQYYVYAVMDSADATTFTGTISASATVPTGKTYYKLLGSFYNDSSGNISNDDSLINYNNYYALRLGDWISKVTATTYQASTDGFVVEYSVSGNGVIGYTDSSNPPTTIRCRDDSDGESSFTMPVKRGDYWKVVGTTAGLYWIPLEREV